MSARQQEAARLFQALHIPGQPLVLFNAWDAGSARAVAELSSRASPKDHRCRST
ncbi:MAG: isocitrate lyase/phosphoenolpyruvate mutase family protein [Pseudomonadota bacterium]|nr:isocitrate lyase/phosphoenolpyruvate mutase family protein [Pseudomonadota bacterium]